MARFIHTNSIGVRVRAVCHCLPPITSEFEHGRRELADYILADAAAMVEKVGFGWVSTSDAPSTYPDLRDAFVWSTAFRQPLPVSSEHNVSVVTSPAVNLAFRFAHDIRHCLSGLTFSIDDEVELAQLQLREMREIGFGRSSVAYKLFAADTLGQALCIALIGRFPLNQMRFARWSVAQGIGKAIVLEDDPCCAANVLALPRRRGGSSFDQLAA